MSESTTVQGVTSLLPKMWEVPAGFRKRLGNRVGRQRVMLEDGHLLLVMHAPPAAGDTERLGRFFWRRPDGVWSSTERGAGFQSLLQHVEDYSARVSEIDEQEDLAASADDYFDVLNQLAPVQRAARNMYDVLSEARKLCSEDRELINVRDNAYELARRIDLLTGHTKTSMEYEVARRTEEQAKASHEMSRAAHRLNLLAAFFFPIATLSSLLGMNVPTGIENLGFPWGLLFVLGVGGISGLFLTIFLGRQEVTK